MFIFGIVILIIGFFIPPIIQNPNPSTAVFWLGFLNVIRSRQLANPENSWWKGAMRGLLCHVLVLVILVFFGDVRFIGYLKYFYSPITYFAHSFPPPQHIHTDIKLILEATYNFLNVFIFILIGAILGKFFIEQKSSQPIN